jgi:hypothetical protein
LISFGWNLDFAVLGKTPPIPDYRSLNSKNLWPQLTIHYYVLSVEEMHIKYSDEIK